MEISLEVGEGKGETDFLKQGNCGGAEVVDVQELYVAACVWWLYVVVMWMFHSLDVFSFFRFYIMV